MATVLGCNKSGNGLCEALLQVQRCGVRGMQCNADAGDGVTGEDHGHPDGGRLAAVLSLGTVLCIDVAAMPAVTAGTGFMVLEGIGLLSCSH
jgi:hypothetical protein